MDTNNEMMTKVLSEAEQFGKDNKLSYKDSLYLRLISEETVEMLVMSGGLSSSADFTIDGDNESCVISLSIDEKDPEGKGSVPFDPDVHRGTTGKISYLLKNGYHGLKQDEQSAAALGVRKAREEDLKELGIQGSTDAYIWSIEAYNILSFDSLNANSNEDWFEISRSIIANISDDIRLLFLPEKTELTIHMTFNREKDDVNEKYAISPEFEELSKVPVAKTGFQVKLVQLLYGRLVDKQVSDDKVNIRKLQIESQVSPKKLLVVLEYSPKGLAENETTPCILFLHGGAFLFPALPYHYRLASSLTERLGCRLFLLMHDLAPKTNPPIQNREAYEIYCHLRENADTYHIDPEKMVVMGDSSGGTMAAAITLTGRNYNKMPAAQVLLYPSMGSRNETPSMSRYSDVPVVNGDSIRAYKKILKPDTSEGNKYYTHPAEAGSLAGLPKSYVETAEFDALHDEGIDYAKRMIKEGVNVTLNETKGTVHAFDMAKDSSILSDTMDKRIAFIKSVF